MKILFTGASSFTGMWFVKELVSAGHEVTAIIRNPYESYSGIRKQRIDQLKPLSRLVFDCSFGSDLFFEVTENEDYWDLFCHHAAEVANYKIPDFNVEEAVRNNTKNIDRLIPLLQKRNCLRILLTGSVFEQGEGTGSDALPAVSAYGLSKTLTSECFKKISQKTGMTLGKFVIPNPFGPYEEERFTYYLMNCWFKGQTAVINTPLYVRDNIPVTLLAKCYRYFTESLFGLSGFQKTNPSWRPESQGEFTKRYAHEMEKRLSIPCSVHLKEQSIFEEPIIRVNTDQIEAKKLGWNEELDWDGIAEYYQRMMNSLV